MSASPNFADVQVSAYSNVSSVLEYLTGLGVNAPDITQIATSSEINTILIRASEAINRKTFRDFRTGGIRISAEIYDGTGSFSLTLKHSPIVNVIQVRVYNGAGAVTRSITSGDTQFSGSLKIDSQNGIITMVPQLNALQTGSNFTLGLGTGGLIFSFGPFGSPLGTEFDVVNRFGRGERNVEVDYTYGFTSTPQQIVEACTKYAARYLLLKRGMQLQGASVFRDEGLQLEFVAARKYGAFPFAGQIEMLEFDIIDAINNWRIRPFYVI